ncbi:MAG TPA: Gfo/Idh/MocA family oxidoreductase [Phycisphaerae bacterium]|nr:Gfo/Idh/MocA family oxidoreductase [Phycisphaerae bacterium]HOI54024.1 Gfo/Idh/MocA family oxidoreductase [Phycisphaerae bacterium]
MKRIRIGQIGICHEHAAGTIETLRKLPEVFEVVGVVDDRRTTAARFAGDNLKPYDGLTWMTEDELLGASGLQAVTVEVPNADLVPTAIRCMERRLAIHMDKPGGEDMGLFRTLRGGCAQRGIPFQMGYMFRTNPAIRFCQRIVRERWLGDVFEIQASMSHDYGDEGYRRYLSHFKGGIMFNLGCHLIDFILPMLGRPEGVVPFLKSTVGAAGARDNCVSVLEYPHATVTLRACGREVDGSNQRRLKICGTEGSVELCPLERFDGKPLQVQLRLRHGNAEYAAGTHTVDFGIQEDRYVGQMLEFAKRVRGESGCEYDCDHDCLVQEVLLAASGCCRWRG